MSFMLFQRKREETEMKSEEEESENLLDAGYKGLSKVFGGSTKLIIAALVILGIIFVITWFKRRK